MSTLGAGRILIKNIIIVCLLNLMAWKASCAHRTGENAIKYNDKIKKMGPNAERLCSGLIMGPPVDTAGDNQSPNVIISNYQVHQGLRLSN